ncbi:hypothetical protein ABZ726_18290 [Streptomyces hundungensis]|uniref:hypothetical protein n=1 Tax=Streptomyces hundungensis TaxID=1077946 RepID=UPI00340A80FF
MRYLISDDLRSTMASIDVIDMPHGEAVTLTLERAEERDSTHITLDLYEDGTVDVGNWPPDGEPWEAVLRIPGEVDPADLTPPDRRVERTYTRAQIAQTLAVARDRAAEHIYTSGRLDFMVKTALELFDAPAPK